MKGNYVNVIGAGLAGCEAAWQAALRGVKVRLYEMKPKKFSPAHKMDTFAELVCSNSLRSDSLENAVGLLKQEMRMLNSIIMKCADETRIPAGGALAVDRYEFSARVTAAVSGHKNIEVISEEVVQIPDDAVTVIATGPLTSESFSRAISGYIGMDYLYFYDAAAHIVVGDTIDMSKAFRGSRYGKGTDDYINCPMNEQEYKRFVYELLQAETIGLKEFEKEILFEGCMPVEKMAARGEDTLRFGPLKPVGLMDPKTGEMPYAVVQLRQDNREASLYNMVGFQTNLKWPEQKRVFRLIPGLENAEFVRFGVMHRNTFINSPKLLTQTYNLRTKPDIFFAGQITGVEGYMESAASGLVAGINAAMKVLGKPFVVFSDKTAIGALAAYVSDSRITSFQPMNINYGIINMSGIKTRNKREKKLKTAERALELIQKQVESISNM